MENKINIDIWSEIIKSNTWTALYGAYVFFGSEKFKEKQLREKINDEIIKKYFTQIKEKRDFSREINSNVVNTTGKYSNENLLWYEEVKIDGEKGYKKISSKGIIDIQEKISKIESEIESCPLSEDGDHREMSHNTNSFTISELVEKIKSGEDAQIPTFQREYVWKHEKVAPLLLSLMKNFPIGSMLLWEEVSGSEKYIILDGLQRTFSLTLISNHPFAYLDYDLFKYVSTSNFQFSETISRSSFDKLNKEWIKHFNNEETTEGEKTIEIMFEKFNNDFQIKKVVNFIIDKWNSIKDEFKIPFILLNDKYNKNETADIFNIINTQGVELNNFEVNSSIWSKTPITIDEELSEDFFIEKWRESKYISYRRKIGVGKRIEVFKESDGRTIEPSDFIYSVFDESSKGKHIIRETFFNNGKLKTTALEPLLTIYATLLEMKDEDGSSNDYRKLLPLIGKKLSEEIKTKKDINNLAKKMEKALSIVETKLVLLKNVVNNSEENVSIHIASSLLSLIVNISIKHGLEKKLSEANEKIIGNLLYIFIEQYFQGKYGSGSTNNAWKELNSGNYKNVTKAMANGIIKKFIKEKNELENKVDSTYDPKFVLVLSLFNSKFVNYTNDEHMQVDHIIPKSLFYLSGSKNVVDFNYVNSFYNLQLIKKSINLEKSSKIDVNNKNYFIMNNFKKELFKDYDKYKNEFNEAIVEVRKSICLPRKDDPTICKKVENPSYDSFKSFIKLQEKYIGKAISETDFL